MVWNELNPVFPSFTKLQVSQLWGHVRNCVHHKWVTRVANANPAPIAYAVRNFANAKQTQEHTESQMRTCSSQIRDYPVQPMLANASYESNQFRDLQFYFRAYVQVQNHDTDLPESSKYQSDVVLQNIDRGQLKLFLKQNIMFSLNFHIKAFQIVTRTTYATQKISNEANGCLKIWN